MEGLILGSEAANQAAIKNIANLQKILDDHIANGQTGPSSPAEDIQKLIDKYEEELQSGANYRRVDVAIETAATALGASGKGLGLGTGFLRGLGNPLRGGIGYKSWEVMRSALGSAGTGKVWHHIVERCQGNCTRSTFPSQMVNNTKNVVAVPNAVNQKLADLYASKQFDFTKGKTLRDWLNGKSFKEQYEYGKKLLKNEMEKYEKDPKNYP
jgi:hypothetical protein